MGKIFGKGYSINTIFNLKEGVTTASSLRDYDFSTIKDEIKAKLDPEPIIFISDPTFGNYIWANGQLFGSIYTVNNETLIF